MSCYGGPEITNDGLVVYYDMSNTQKSWKGAPTTNMVNPALSTWGVDGSGNATVGTRTDLNAYECIVVNNGSSNYRLNKSITITAGVTYTFSIKYKKIYGTASMTFQIQARNVSNAIVNSIFTTTAALGITDIEGYQTASYTFTPGTGSTTVLWFINTGQDYSSYNNSFSWKEVQMEVGSFATPFVNGTRSTTQALLDLTNNNTLTTSSLTYAANNTFSFNGTSNYISCGNLGTFYSTGTISMWINSAVMANWNNAFSTQTGNIGIRFEENALGNFGVVIGNDSASYTGHTYFASGMLTNTWYNIVLVWNVSGNNVIGYLNGTQVFNEAQTYWATTLPTVTIGAWAGPVRYWNGSISNVGIYNTALSANQVKQNFNAIRGRYGI